MLLKCGVNVDAADYDSRTCLHLAACEGNLHIQHVLQKHVQIDLHGGLARGSLLTMVMVMMMMMMMMMMMFVMG